MLPKIVVNEGTKPAPDLAGVRLHPVIDNGLLRDVTEFHGAALSCHCREASIELKVSCRSTLSYLCGCDVCWKPDGALFSLVSVVPTAAISLTRNSDKLHLVTQEKPIARYACRDCGVHMVGRINDPIHPFFGLDIIHMELSDQTGFATPEFAGFLSALSDSGVSDARMEQIRARLAELAIPAYEHFPPALGSGIPE